MRSSLAAAAAVVHSVVGRQSRRRTTPAAISERQRERGPAQVRPSPKGFQSVRSSLEEGRLMEEGRLPLSGDPRASVAGLASAVSWLASPPRWPFVGLHVLEDTKSIKLM